MVNYIPKQKDIVYVNFNPIKGHEQSGYRPGVVISNDIFNKFSKMIIVCPITSNLKKFPTHHKIENSQKIEWSVLCEHVRSVDYEKRDVKFIEKMSDEDFDIIKNLLISCID